MNFAQNPQTAFNKMHKRALIAAILIAIGSPALAADPNGDWRVADGTAVIRMAPCYDLHVETPAGSNPDPRYALCGVIAWTKSPSGNDDKNPDPSKRSRPIIGLPILLDMKPDGRGRWNGEVYNAESGQTYTSYIYLKSDDVLRIEGCLLVFCGG